MIIMDIKVDNIYAFKDFHINMSYPKKIVNSTIENEFLEERTNFRYKKVNIIMGTNATGKTTMGKLLMLFTNYLNDGGYKRFTNRIADVKKAALKTKIFFFIIIPSALYLIIIYYQTQMRKAIDEKFSPKGRKPARGGSCRL